MRRRRLSYEERAYIDVVPLVDTLLAVFLFLAILAFQSPMVFLAIKLPFSKEAQKQELTKVLRLEVLKDGTYRYQGNSISLDGIDSLLSSSPADTVVIEADQDVEYKHVVALIDVLKKHQVQNLLLASRKLQ
ncbi:ExbD/TolR family protein [Thermocrinis minervae]|uniref:Biopolymer transport protein ExbD n=1 Tax=Thermocrinis minervae TaxID=381751 RepID=A0A1M6QR28_9AQUI|nr:biopolymer transporter ExbD [Thermocrinis minervae]SHK22749.1 biopolymer transport protein ExbD [Thermocrinis minervae]